MRHTAASRFGPSRASILRRMCRTTAVLVIGATLALAACEPPAAPPPPEPADASAPDVVDLLFIDATHDLGLDFAIDRAVAGDYFMPDSMTGGCALFDYDGDGDLDLYIVNAFRAADGRTTTPEGANRLYRQEPDGRFADVTTEAGAGHRGYGMGVAAGDYDNDGDVDLYVTCYGPDTLLRNEGDGTFSDVGVAAGIRNDAWSASAAFFDYDGDGFLDVFVANYLAYDHEKVSRDAAGRREYAAPHMFDGVPDVLYRNAGDGTFTDVSIATGIGAVPGRGLGAACLDLDDDGRPDVYVANDGDPNFAWMNRNGSFVEEALQRGLALSNTGQREAGMGIAVGDCDGDRHEDLFITHLVQETNTLYRRVAPGLFEDATTAAGLGAASIDATAFGTAFLDVELDGDLDLLAVNGRVLRRVPHPAANLGIHWTPYAEPNQLFINDGAGRYTEAPFCGALRADVEVSRGLAVGDVDGDGDLDAVVTNGNGTVKIYRNEARRAGHWLVVRAVDPALSRDAIGATVEVIAGSLHAARVVRAAPGYLSSSDPRPHFGLGPYEAYDDIVVRWPDGSSERFGGGAADRVVEVRRGEGAPEPAR